MKSCPTLLITDDDHALRDTLSSVFASRGFNTLLAGDGREAFDVVCRQEVHLVLIDFNMPRMTGLEALKAIKEFNERMPVILMSAELDQEMSDEILAADAYSVHAKPIDLGQIRCDISNALQTIYNWSVDC